MYKSTNGRLALWCASGVDSAALLAEDEAPSDAYRSIDLS